ncbi:hypothetical protein F4806DRAFT_508444 [Annulohypoxylon nitens]|nr:hypothetical protein F4806DRAFT_508444 [Annulohypoxylon nitens]
MDRIVFRLRQLPSDIDKLEILGLLGKALGIHSSGIRIFSLASSVNPWRPRKVATLMFDATTGIQQILEEGRPPAITKHDDEWVIQADSLGDNWILDSHFRGLTALYDPPLHSADCIVISGLASHPFGSWQPKGQSKTFMWIRDALPRSLPHLRPILYGYNSELLKSHSFQSTFDLAVALIKQLQANGWESPMCRPLAFLAHSLGGIILKQALVLLAGTNDHVDPVIQAMKGVIFFGVPNLGMVQSHLEAVVVGQANINLIKDLSPKSAFLHQLDEQFSGVSALQSCLIYWCYETMESSTVARDSDGKWSRTGPKEILVTPESATRGLYGDDTKRNSIFPINKDHSDIVKFSENDSDYLVIVRQLNQMFSLRDTARVTDPATNIVQNLPSLAVDSQNSPNQDDVLISLQNSETDRRLLEIEDKYKNTFSWVYNLSQPGFNQWLQNSTGLFWIRGKPGSGKSTLMKFIFQDERTSYLLSDWSGEKEYIRAAFFFHHRGTPLQKSFEGLLRSIILQLISKKPALRKFVHDRPDHNSGHWTLGVLQQSLSDILRQEEVPLHLCLFLDALDEYDGPLEFLCQFLQDLAAIAPKPNRQIKICFSSRPWDIFMRTFRGCAGFQIHDFTRNDIRDYCLGSIRDENLSTTAFESWIPDIVTRSRGVFLWVKLLIKDLAARAKSTTINSAEIKSRLESYPAELDSLYAEIIQRIPRPYRWMTYIMLETTARSVERLPPVHFLGILDCSSCKTYSETLGKFWGPHRSKQPLIPIVRWYSKKYCGGLIEVVDTSRGPYVQVIHQTVEDFVKNPKFKQLVLEERSNDTTENGYTFLAKYHLVKDALGEIDEKGRPYYRRPFPHGYPYQSERTTGRSLKAFFDSIPRDTISALTEDPTISTPLSLAAWFHCPLYFIESLKFSPTLLQDCTELLLSCADTRGVDEEDNFNESFHTIKILLENGFTPDRDPKVFEYLVTSKMWTSSLPSTINALLKIIEILLKHGQNPDVKVSQEWLEKYAALELATLHLPECPLELYEILLDNGATVNILDVKGRTPVDFWCEIAYIKFHDEDMSRAELPEWHKRISFLVSRGGTPSSRGVRYSKRLLRIMKKEGLPIDDLEKCLSRPGKTPRYPLRSRATKLGLGILNTIAPPLNGVREIL